MILKASERANSAWLGRHLLNVDHNEHVEIHDIRGFMAEDIMGAMKEAQAMSYGTRCENYLFSLSMNPPAKERVRPEVFERVVATIEERLNLAGHARIMVFHEKEGRRHCHTVWSRIDPETMTAKNLPHFKNKLCEVSREQYLEHGWQMPPDRGASTMTRREAIGASVDKIVIYYGSGVRAAEGAAIDLTRAGYPAVAIAGGPDGLAEVFVNKGILKTKFSDTDILRGRLGSNAMYAYEDRVGPPRTSGLALNP